MPDEKLFSADPEGSIELEFGLTLRAFQVPLQNRQSLWVAPRAGLTILYGKNGTGKSTIIRELSTLLCPDVDVADLDPRGDQLIARQFLQLDLDPAAVQMMTELLDGYYNRKKRKWSPPRHLRAFGIDEWNRNGIPNKKHDVITPRSPDQTFSEWVKELLHETGDHSAETSELLGEAGQKILDEYGRQPWSWTTQLFEQIRHKLAADFMTGSWVGVTLAEVNEKLASYSFETIDTDEGELAPENLDALSYQSLLRLYCFQVLDALDQAMDEVIDDDTVDMFCHDAVEMGRIVPGNHKLRELVDDASYLTGLLAFALREAIERPTFWLERISEFEYSVGLAIPTPMAGQISGSENAKQLFDFLLFIANPPETVAPTREVGPWQMLLGLHQHVLGESHGLDDRRINDSRKEFGGCYPETRFIALEPGKVGPLAIIEGLPFRAFDLGREVSPDKVAVRSLISSLDGSERIDGSHKWDYEVDFDGKDVQLVELTKRFEEVAELVRQFDIGVRDIVVSVSNRLRNWADGRAVTVRFDVTGTRDEQGTVRPVSFEKLSAAQRYWVSAAMQIVAARNNKVATLLLADEPEAGLHERAAHRVFSRLAAESQNFFIASHSVSALRQRAASLLHLSHGTGERIFATPVGLGEDVRRAAERLGTSSFDLLAMKRALVVVEGAHDEAVVRRLLRMSQHAFLSDQCLVIPARGVQNVAHIADSAIITDFTEMEILAVVDNGRAEIFSEVLLTIESLAQSGMVGTEVLKNAGLHKLHSRATPEERFMIDLIVRATERGLAHRVHVFALPTPDIIDLLPAASFGLTLHWQELREEFGRERPVENFKNWLRKKYKVKVSVSAVEASFDALDSIPEPLGDLLREIEILCSLDAAS